MSEPTGKKKPRRGAKGRGGGRGLPARGDEEDRCGETRRIIQAQPSTPHRAFDKFNDSVDNVNTDDIRDMQPGDRSVLYSGISSGIAELDADDIPNGDGDGDGVADELPSSDVGPDPAVASLEGSAEGTDRNHVLKRTEQHGAAVDEEELVRELNACEAEGDQQEPVREAGPEGDVDDRLSADRYFYGPAQIHHKRRGGLFSPLRHRTGPLPGEGCAARSSVEVAEALLLGVLGEWGVGQGQGQGQGQRGSDDLRKEPIRQSAEGGAPHSAAARGGLSGVLGYVLHTLMTLYYRLFVHIPLLVLHWLASHLWSATTSITALAYVVASACLSAAVWACLLPLRTAQRVLVWVWQHSLVLAVDFLNQPPSAFGDARTGPGSHKQAVPVALNGHVHKH